MNSKKLTRVLFVLYLIALTWLIVLKTKTSFYDLPQLRNINLIPFGDPTIINGSIAYQEIYLNVLTFIPFGTFVCALWQKKTFLKVILPVFLTSLIYEIIQYIFAIGASDITDIILNTLGGIVGIGIFMVLYKIFKEKTCKIVNIVFITTALLLILLITVILMTDILLIRF